MELKLLVQSVHCYLQFKNYIWNQAKVGTAIKVLAQRMNYHLLLSNCQEK